MKQARFALKPDIGVVVYTYDRVLDAKINLEIIRYIWQPSGLFKSIRIVHAFSGRRKWYPKPTLEDSLIRLPNVEHYQTAAELIDDGIKRLTTRYPDCRYAVVLAADTWLVKPEVVGRILRSMADNQFRLASCPWGLPRRNKIQDVGLAMDWFMVDLRWVKKSKMFPLRYQDFLNKYREIFLYLKGASVSLEKVAFVRYLEAIMLGMNSQMGLRIQGLERLYRIKGREPVHSHIDAKGYWIRKFYWPKLGLITHHNLEPKRRILKQLGLKAGPVMARFIKQG